MGEEKSPSPKRLRNLPQVMANMVAAGRICRIIRLDLNVAARSAEMEMMGRLGLAKAHRQFTLLHHFVVFHLRFVLPHHRAVMLGGTLAVRHRNRRQK